MESSQNDRHIAFVGFVLTQLIFQYSSSVNFELLHIFNSLLIIPCMATHSPASTSVPEPSLQTKERRKNGKRLERKKEGETVEKKEEREEEG